MFVAYLRVSSADQNLERQKQLISDWKLKKETDSQDVIFFEEKVSGKNVQERTQLLNALDYLRERDTLVITSLDHLGRNSTGIRDLLQQVRSKGANVEIFDLTSFSGATDDSLRNLLSNLVIEVFSYVAESEQKNFFERQEQKLYSPKKVFIRDIF